MNSLKGKLTIATCISCMFCLLITAVISYSTASGRLQEKESQKAELLAQNSAEEIDKWLYGYATYQFLPHCFVPKVLPSGFPSPAVCQMPCCN